jgi:hypothetical protein
MKVPKIVLGAGVMAPALALLPASPAEASTEINLHHRMRDVTVVDAQGTEHDCELTFSLSLSTNWDAGGEWGAGWTSSGTYDGDPYCNTATVEVTVFYGSGGTEYRSTATRSTPFPGNPPYVSVGVSAEDAHDPVTGRPLGFDHLSSSHRVSFPACQCVFTETLVARK